MGDIGGRSEGDRAFRLARQMGAAGAGKRQSASKQRRGSPHRGCCPRRSVCAQGNSSIGCADWRYVRILQEAAKWAKVGEMATWGSGLVRQLTFFGRNANVDGNKVHK